MKLSITIASVPDREDVVAELWCDDTQWGEVFLDDGQLKLVVYPHPTNPSWTFLFDEAAALLHEAKDRLDSLTSDNQDD